MQISGLCVVVSAALVAGLFDHANAALPEPSKTSAVTSYYPHWVSRNGTVTDAIMKRLEPGTIIAVHHQWDLAEIRKILDCPGKRFQISWYAEANVQEVEDPTPTGTSVATRIAEARAKQSLLERKYPADRFANLIELDGAREKKDGQLRGRGNSRRDWLQDAIAAKRAGFRYVAKSPRVAHVQQLRSTLGRDFVAHIVFEDVTGKATDDNPGYGAEARELLANGEKLTLVIHEGAYGGFPATSFSKAAKAVKSDFKSGHVEAYWGRQFSPEGFVKLSSFSAETSAPRSENTAATQPTSETPMCVSDGRLAAKPAMTKPIVNLGYHANVCRSDRPLVMQWSRRTVSAQSVYTTGSCPRA